MSGPEDDPYDRGDRRAIAFALGFGFGAILAFVVVYYVFELLDLVCQTLPSG